MVTNVFIGQVNYDLGTIKLQDQSADYVNKMLISFNRMCFVGVFCTYSIIKLLM